MKRTVMMMMAGLCAMGLAACGDNAPKKPDEAKPEVAVEQTQDNQESQDNQSQDNQDNQEPSQAAPVADEAPVSQDAPAE